MEETMKKILVVVLTLALIGGTVVVSTLAARPAAACQIGVDC
jgi:hypothetical protein